MASEQEGEREVGGRKEERKRKQIYMSASNSLKHRCKIS